MQSSHYSPVQIHQESHQHKQRDDRAQQGQMAFYSKKIARIPVARIIPVHARIIFPNSFAPNKYAIPAFAIVLLITASVMDVTAIEVLISPVDAREVIEIVIASTSARPAS